MLLNFFWGCLLGGLIFALVTVIFGDLLGDVFHGLFDALSFEHLDFLQPMVFVSGITIFGGTGVVLTQYTSLNPLPVVVVSFLLAVLLSILIYFAYVKPMKNSENSTGYSMQDLVGLTGEVSTAIPAKGYGEVILRIGAGHANHIAASQNGEELATETNIFVAKVEKGIVYVVRQN
jgi:membrane protein implicated in regulation of membrane protease activity